MRLRNTVTWLLITALVSVSGIESASAHTKISKSQPAAGATVNTWPAQVSITFSEPLLVLSGRDINWIKVSNALGKRIDTGKWIVRGSTLVVPVKKPLSPGLFKVLYRVVASDGHSVSNSFTFTYQPPASK